MTHGRPDYGITNAAKTTYQIADAGEMAVRLGSPVSYDRRGDVMWWDDFECGLNKWSIGTDGAGGAVALSTVTARNGANSVLISAAVGAGNTDGMNHDQAIPVRSRCGAEFSFTTNAAPAGGPANILLQCLQFDNGFLYHGVLKIDMANLKLYVLNDVGAYVQVGATLPALTMTLTLFHTVKLVWDANTHKYVRLLLDDLSFDISAIGIQGTAVAVSYYLSIGISATGNAAFASNLWVDDVILTQNEP